MAVTVLLGKGRSGKSARCYGQMRASAAQGRKVLLIVPDQATYSVERRFAAESQGQGFLGTQIVGFSRLAYQVFAELGLTHESLSELSQKIILQRLLHQHSAELTVLQTAARQPNFALTAAHFLSECRSFCISPAALQQVAAKLNGSTFGHKLEDLSLLYDAYEQFLAAHFGSADDTMTLLEKSIGRYSFIQDARVWVDGFQWFTPQQLDVLAKIEKAAAQVTITLTMDTDHLAAQRRETALFHRGYEVYGELKRRFPHVETVPVRRSDTSALGTFYEHFFQIVPESVAKPVPALMVYEAASKDLEIETAARKITALCQQGYRYRDFLLLARNSEVYQEKVERIFARYGLPCFSDYRRPMERHPLAEMIEALLDVFRHRWSQDTLFRLLKSDLFPLPREAVDELENYCLACGIQGYHWLSGKAWTYRLSGNKRQENAGEEEKLQRINQSRSLVLSYLQPMQDESEKNHSLRQWCTLLYQWLGALQVPAALRRWQEEDTAAGRTTEGKEHEQVWKRILSFLDEIVGLCGDDETTFADFAQMVEDGLGTLTFSLIPPTLDHITLTSVERGYTMQAKVVFLFGLNDGVFPQHSSEEGLLSDRERQHLQKMGLAFGPGSRFRSFQERFLFYLAVTRAEKRLYLSYALADDDGGALEKASWIHQLLDKGYVDTVVTENGEIAPGKEKDYLLALPAALDYLPAHIRPAVDGEAVADVWWALYDWALGHGWKRRAMQSVAGLFQTNLPAALPAEVVRRLFAPQGTLRGSVTKFEQYRSCPFAYFARYGLGLEERPLYRFAAPDLGLLVHGALRLLGDRLLREKKQWQDIPDDKVAPLCREATEALAPDVQHDILMSNAYFAQIKERLIRTLTRTVRRLKEFSTASDFHMEGLEKSFGRADSPWKALQFTTKNGLHVVVTGQIDRIDSLEIGDKKYLVIIDYKSGRKELDISQIFTGIELQLLTYMFVALLNSGPNAVPAAVLYCYVRDDRQSLAAGLSEEEKKKQFNEKNKLKGFFLNDSQVMQELDTSMQGRSEFLNLQLKKDGTLSDRSHVLYNEEGWSQLLSLAGRRIKDIAAHISDGDISIKPLLLGQQSACSHCPYQAFCRFDLSVAGNQYILAGREDKKELIKKIFQEGDDEDGLD